MFQLIRSLWQRFHKNQPQPCPVVPVSVAAPSAVSTPTVAPVPTVDWASIIWSYVSSFYKNGWSLAASDRARKECDDRGLAYGKVRITSGDQHSVQLCPLGEQKLTTAQVKDAIAKAVDTLGLTDEVEVRDGYTDEVEVITKEGSALSGWGTCSARGSYTTFAEANCWGGGGLREMRAASEQALRVLLHALASLGFPAGQKHYSHESPVKIEDVVIYAVRWEDPQTKCRYLDVLWHPEFVKHHILHGSNRSHERTEGAYKGEVLACQSSGDWWPKMTINNRPVYSTIVENPTPHMLEAKEKFAKESVRVCAYCGKPATREFMHVHFEETGDFGGSSMGGISYGCDDPECAAKAREQKSLRTEECSYTQEVWA